MTQEKSGLASRVRRRPRQAQILAQRGALVGGAEQAAPLQFRDHHLDEIVEPLRQHRRHDVEAVGGPADELERWFVNKAADGFNIMPPVLPEGLNDFVEMVIPELQRRGLFRTAYEGTTLRENLGLPWPTPKARSNA